MMMNMEVYKKYKGKKILFILLGLSLAFLIGLVIMLLWNWLMPSIFNMGTITYWQAVGLLVLSKILFGGGWFKGRYGGGNRHWFMKREFMKRCASMSDAEKEKMKEGIKSSFEN